MSNSPKVAAIVAMDESRVIGINGTLPWRIPADMAHFRTLTTGNVVVMGRKTWDSLPPAFRPLPARTNIVISRTPSQLNLPEGVLRAGSPEAGVALARDVAAKAGVSVWIIGGAELYRALLPVCDEVHLTVVAGKHDGDAWLPEFESDFMHTSERSGDGCTFHVYTRKAETLR
jgi:dihydrofolate reductase